MMDILESIGTFLNEHFEIGFVIVLGLLCIVIITQCGINQLMEEDLDELSERVETLEKMNGVVREAEESEEE